MIEFSISYEEIKFFIALVVVGGLFNVWTWKRAFKKGFDDCAWSLESMGIISVDDETLEIKRVSDKEFKIIQREYGLEE